MPVSRSGTSSLSSTKRRRWTRTKRPPCGCLPGHRETRGLSGGKRRRFYLQSPGRKTRTSAGVIATSLALPHLGLGKRLVQYEHLGREIGLDVVGAHEGDDPALCEPFDGGGHVGPHDLLDRL